MKLEIDNSTEIIEIRSANGWVRAGRAEPMPKTLFGDLWLEGEMAVLFGDTGSGKSVLATAIAESLARGRSVGPFENTVRPRKVLYVDLDLSSKQFEMRYTADHDPAKGEFSRKPYRFSERLQRIELRPEMLPKSKDAEFEIDLRRMLAALVERTGANVLIIDSLSHVKRTADETRGWVAVLKELKRLKQDTGISILVLAGTLKRSPWRTLSSGDVQGSRAVANFADNIFAIGRSRREPNQRYIKHVRPRSSELVFGTDHVPLFRIAKTGGNFLTFEFLEFASEADLVRNAVESWADESLIETVKHLSESGMSIRRIAAELDISKSAVHRYLHIPFAADDDDFEDLDEEAEEFDPTKAWNYFPGREEFDAAKKDQRFDDIYGREDATARALGRESYLIEVATANARRQYLKTGHAPTFAEAWAEVMEEERKRVQKANGLEGEMSGEAGDGVSDFDEGVKRQPRKKSPSEIFGTTTPLTPSYDGYGNQIFVETFDEHTSKPTVWYQADKKGNKFRFVRGMYGPTREELTE